MLWCVGDCGDGNGDCGDGNGDCGDGNGDFGGNVGGGGGGGVCVYIYKPSYLYILHMFPCRN